MTEKFPLIEDQGDRVILRGDLGEAVMLDITCSETDGIDAFNELFELDSADYLGDPTDSFYQVITFTRIIRRRSDGKKFGYTYWSSPGNDSMETTYEQDLEALGIEVEHDDDWNPIGGLPYVFLPVEPFTRIGYAVTALADVDGRDHATT